MLQRARRHGMSVLGQLRRVVSPNRPLSPLALHSALIFLPCHCKPAILGTQVQLRVLQTQSNTKRVHNPPTPPRSLSWCSTAHRTRHTSSSTMTAKTQTRSHGHSHGHHGHHHHHHHDNTFLLSKNKKDAGVRITRIGLYVNLGMAVGKGVGGYVFNSQGNRFNAPETASVTNTR